MQASEKGKTSRLSPCFMFVVPMFVHGEATEAENDSAHNTSSGSYVIRRAQGEWTDYVSLQASAIVGCAKVCIP